MPSAGHFRRRFASFQRHRPPADPRNSLFRANTPRIYRSTPIYTIELLRGIESVDFDDFRVEKVLTHRLCQRQSKKSPSGNEIYRSFSSEERRCQIWKSGYGFDKIRSPQGPRYATMGLSSNLTNYLRRRSPGLPFPPDPRQAGERGATTYAATPLWP